MRKLIPAELNNLSLISRTGLDSSLLELTATGLEKSIMDATTPIRRMLVSAGLHDYSTQLQGPQHKEFLQTTLFSEDRVKRVKASLYRPRTKNGDPRIWFLSLIHI